jgi:hypothetical protein
MDDTTPHWFKSSYSDASCNCVEVAFTDVKWFKSSHSDVSNGECVEIALTRSGGSAGPRLDGHSGGAETVVLVRDTRDRCGAVLDVAAPEWMCLLRLVSRELAGGQSSRSRRSALSRHS